MTDTRPPARTYAKGDRRRGEIVATAFRVFAADGYRGASMVQIAAACGVSRAGLLHHFSTKESLLAAVLEERDRVNGELFFVGMDPVADGVDYFHRLIRVVEHNATERELVRLYASLSVEAAEPHHPAHDYFVARYGWSRTHVAQALDSIRGEASPESLGVASGIVALIDGLQVQWLLDPTAVDMALRLRLRLSELTGVVFGRG